MELRIPPERLRARVYLGLDDRKSRIEPKVSHRRELNGAANQESDSSSWASLGSGQERVARDRQKLVRIFKSEKFCTKKCVF